MKKNIFLFLTVILFAFETQGQSIEKVKGDLVAKFKNVILDGSWTLEEGHEQILLNYIDTFFVNSVLGPINNTTGWSNKLDSLFIKIRFEENWSSKRVNSLKAKQKKMLAPMIEKYIAHYDSLKWRNIKSNKDLFLVRPVSNLEYWDGLNKDESLAIQKLIRLPDKVIGKVGIFIGVKFNPCGSYIEPRKVGDKVGDYYSLFSEIIGSDGLYKCEPVYQ